MGKPQETLTPGIGKVRAWLDGIGGGRNEPHFVYHVGHLAFDRGQWIQGEDNLPRWVIAGEVDKIGELMWKAHERGEVVLTQRRVGRYNWLYIAQRSLQVRRTMSDRETKRA